MMRFFVAFALAVCAMAFEYDVGEGGHYHRPVGWVDGGRADPKSGVDLLVAVSHTAEQRAKLETTINSVSDIESPLWGQHLTRDQVDEIMAPTASTASTVRAWLASCGVSHPVDTDLLRLDVTVDTAECLLQAEYHVWTQNDMTVTRLSGPYTVPAGVIDAVRPSVAFPSLTTGRVRVSSPSDIINDPKQLRKLYNADGMVGTRGQSGVVQGFANFLGQHWDQADYTEFQHVFMNWTTPYNISRVFGDNKGLPGGEASLDSQYITGVTGASVETWSYTTNGNAPTNPANEPWLAWLWTLGNQTKIPSTLSASYGEDEKSVGYNYASRINVELQKIGVRGTSLFISSGDSGAGGNCTEGGRLTPNFPAGSPWVTAVGGLVGGTPGSEPTGETGDNISGGGFSDWWPRPAWQQAEVEAYFKSNVSFPKADRFNSSGRGYPDVAAQSEDFLVVWYLIPEPVAGTSCASPTVAGLVSLVNEHRAATGKPTLGFLNPLLYKLRASAASANSFNDALSGTNFGCSGYKPGFTATAGWDAVTGLGSLNTKNLAAAVDALEAGRRW